MKCKEEIHSKCENNVLCHLCDGISLYKNTKEERERKQAEKAEKQKEEKLAPLKTYKREKKEGMAFEKRVQSQWNNRFATQKKKKVAKPNLFDELMEEEEEKEQPVQSIKKPISSMYANRGIKQEAKRQANSGALWHAKGDITLEHALMECKERGTVNSRGEKQITIPKLWLDKQAQEAFQEKKPYWYLPFGFKGSEEVYLIKPYDHEMELIAEVRRLQEENEKLKKGK